MGDPVAAMVRTRVAKARARLRAATLAGTLLALTTAGLAVAGSAPAAAEEPTAGKPRVVQLGDSYSSGNGAAVYTDRTCYRSPRNYGQRFATAIGATYVNRACSGGVVADLTQPRELRRRSVVKTYWIDPARPRASFLAKARADGVCGDLPIGDSFWTYGLSGPVVTGKLMTATVQCVLKARPQINGVTRGTDVVLLTMGGNDVGFSEIATQCLALRNGRTCRAAIDRARSQLPGVRTRLTAALRQVNRRAPRARVLLLGYPYLLDTKDFTIGAIRYNAGAELAKLQDQADAQMRQGVRGLNSSTPRKPFRFANVKPEWGNHGLDPRFGADNYDAWLVGLLEPGRDYAEYVHPRLAGWAASAKAALRVYRAG